MPEPDGWLPMDKAFPLYNQLVIAINRFGDQIPEIMQWRKPDFIYNDDEAGYFLCIADKWNYENNGAIEPWNPVFQNRFNIKMWKPLNLPTNDEERLLLDIESWFEDE